MGLTPGAAYTAPKDVIAAVDVHTTSLGTDGSDPAPILEVQSKAGGDRARERAGDKLQPGSERSIQKTSCLQQRPQVQPGDIQRQDWSLTHS